uniref:Uncharacterized protein n=1 Tax=Romanomermis culicivorax TaxID=13658 RepID=A0A915KJQ2_ROMCU
MVKKHRKGCFRAAKTKDLIDSHVMETAPEKVDIDQPLPTTTYVTPVDKVGSSAKKRGRPSTDDSTSNGKTSDQPTSDATPAKIQKGIHDLNISDVSMTESLELENSRTTTPVSRKAQNIKGKKGFQKRSTVARALFTASQELMPPPATTNVLDQPTSDSTTLDSTLSDLTPNLNATFEIGSAVIEGSKPPDIAGVELYGKKGGMTNIPYFDPNVDPACYPLLFPYGTQGYKYGIMKADPNNKKANDDLAAQFDAGKEGGTLYTDDDLDWNDDYLDAEDNGMEEIMKSSTQKRDKISALRYMTGIEALWRIYGYPIVHKSHRVVRQWVNGPQGTAIIFHEGYEREAQSDATGAKKRSMTQAYFDVCKESPLAKTLTYDQLGKYFRFDTKERRWLPRKKGNPDKYIVRIGSFSPVNRELFCVRILLFNVKGPTSFEELRTVDGKVYESFEGACAARNLLDNDEPGIYWTTTTFGDAH